MQRQRVRLDHPQPAGRFGGEFAHGFRRPRIHLDGRNGRRRRIQQRARQPARPRPDLDDMPPRQIPRLAHDARGQVLIEQKVLAEGPPRRQAVTRDDVTEGNPIRDRGWPWR